MWLTMVVLGLIAVVSWILYQTMEMEKQPPDWDEYTNYPGLGLMTRTELDAALRREQERMGQ